MRSLSRTLTLTAALAVALAACPALANHGHARAHGYGGYQPAYYPPPPGPSFRVDPALAARCGLGAGSVRPAAYHLDYGRRHDRRRGDDGVGGALIGGAVGGLLGNRIAGHGDRVVGTVAGAAVGAIAGAAIDRAEDRETRYADRPDYNGSRYDGPSYSAECDSVLPPGYRLVSIPGGQECRDEVTTTEEWVPEEVTLPARPSYRAPPRDKRTKLRRVK